MHLTYDDQLVHKRARVREAMTRHPALATLVVHDVAPADPRSFYRTRAKVMVGPGGRVGLFATGADHEIVDTPGCIVLAPALAQVLEVLRAMVVRDELARDGSPLAPPTSPSAGGLVAIDLREVRPPPSPETARSRVLVTWVIRRSAASRLEKLRAAAVALCRSAPEVLGVAVNFHDGVAPQVLGKETMLLAGQSWGDDALGESVHRATFGSFVQAHRGQAARVHARIAATVFGDGETRRPEAPRVLDLYGGSGAIALGLASRGADVLLVESFEPAVQYARDSAHAAGLTLEALCDDVAHALGRLAGRSERFDAIVVNPPRRGLAPAVRARLAQISTGTVVYVSCQPETLARDLDHLARLGLRATELWPVDMIPLTEEVETVAVLSPGPPSLPAVLFEDADVIILDKPPHEPTTPQGEHRGSLLDRARQLPGSARAVPVHRLDVGTSGIVVFAKDPSRVAAWAQAIGAEDATKAYVAAVRGVPDERGAIDLPLVIDGKTKHARTSFERESVLDMHAILRVFPDEGRTHQIRRHLASIGHAVLGDDRYGHAPTNRFFLEKHGLDRTFLHAAKLELRHPRTRRRLVVEAPLPGDLASVVRSVASAAGAPARIAR